MIGHVENATAWDRKGKESVGVCIGGDTYDLDPNQARQFGARLEEIANKVQSQ